jgi:N-acetylmuramoyl-L-alanine amidase
MREMAMAIVLLGSTTAIAAPFRVVIDAGHGGSNTGAPGLLPGAYEKRVTLAVARALVDELRARGLEVVMTRDHDEYLTLRERVRRANAADPDCFVSLHTNASGARSRHGVETWVLARDAAEVEARRAASREKDDVRSMLRELELLDAARASAQLARAVQSEVVAATGGQDRGVRQYGYDVLAGVTAPAVLVEMGFLDHPIEGAALLDGQQQHRIAAALASGIARFADDVRSPQKLVLSAAAHDNDTARRPAP